MKSNVSNQEEMLRVVYQDACSKCIADVSDLRDLETIMSRVKYEGDEFLTITLPNFARDFEKSLELGFVDPSCFKSFKKYGQIPALLRGMVGQVFNYETGRIYEEKNCKNWSDIPTIIESVRQLCLTFKKIEDTCAPKRVTQALRNFSSIERDFQCFNPSPEDVQGFTLISSMLWGNLLASNSLDKLHPRHGPGATADRISGNQKYRWLTWHERLEPYFPFLGNAYPIGAYDSKEFELVTFIPVEQELPVRVITVPKTMKSPRIIAIEPACMQYVQQAIRDFLYRKLESSELVGGQVNFTDQSINQMLAMESSESGSFATVDLSDASDRVPLELAMHMFDSNPDLQDAIIACRTTHARLPNGTVIGPLKKFASMGSALCFPIEAMYFYTICVMALLEGQHLSVSFANLSKVCQKIYVYGDDLIVPTDQATIVLAYLQKYNCKVNSNKTFVSGNFRESCGVDAYRGYEVTPVYLRKKCPENKHQASEIISWVASANAFYMKGYWQTATFMFNQLERIIGQLPYVGNNSEGLGRVSFLGYRSVERWNPRYQRFEVKALTPRPVYRSDMIDGYSALAKSLHDLKAFDPSKVFDRDASKLERSALFGAVALTRRWVPAS